MRALVVHFIWITSIISCFVSEARLEPEGSPWVTVLCLPTALMRVLLPHQTDLTWFFAACAILAFSYLQLVDLLDEIEEKRAELRKLRLKRIAES